MNAELAPLTLVLGSAASGKSLFGEDLITSSGYDPIYLATARTLDSEMQSKVHAHKRQRGPGWKTVEAPFCLSRPLRSATSDQAILLDCATMWLSNHMLEDHDCDNAIDELLQDLAYCGAKVVIISNELGGGIVPENKLARRFQNTHGIMNQRLAAAADAVALVTAGLPMWLKRAA